MLTLSLLLLALFLISFHFRFSLCEHQSISTSTRLTYFFGVSTVSHFLNKMGDIDEILILQVQSFPALFNKRDPKFKNKLAKENAWKTIGDVLELDPVTCEQRWTTLRAKYTNIKKKIRDLPSGSGADEWSGLSWPYYDIMKFLDPFLVTRRTTTNFKTSVSEVTTVNSWDTMVQLLEAEPSQERVIYEPAESGSSGSTLPSPDLSEETTSGSSCSSTATPIQRIAKTNNKEGIYSPSNPKKKKNTQDELMSTMTNCFKNFGDKMERNKSDDLDFASSLAKDMAALSLEEKIVFKSDVYLLLSKVISNRKK